MPLVNIVEDPVMRDSQFSYFVQVADLAAHALYRKLYPKTAYKKHNADKLFDALAPICHPMASKYDPHGMGIVHC